MRWVHVLLLSSLRASLAFIAPSSRRPTIFGVLATELEEDDAPVVFDVPDFDAMMDEDDDASDQDESIRKPHSRWSSLKSTGTRQKSQRQQNRVVPPGKEGKQEKKRRMLMFMKEKERERKKAARVERRIPLTMRTPLAALKPGTKLTGIVISLTNFGAYVDVGTECDGLLHISQISDTYFVEHPKYVLAPGEEVEVIIKSLSPQLKKLHLTMLKPNEQEDDDDNEEPILLDDLEVDDELWGEIVRVTDYGAYVNVGAQVRGFLHFMDHPFFGKEPGAHPSSYMEVGQRVRVWVSTVDHERNRIKLTANRPPHLPGPRRELS